MTKVKDIIKKLKEFDEEEEIAVWNLKGYAEGLYELADINIFHNGREVEINLNKSDGIEMYKL